VKVRYTLRALRHLSSIADHIAERNPEAARGVGARILETIDLMAAFPQMGHTLDCCQERAKWWCRDCRILWCIGAMGTRW